MLDHRPTPGPSLKVLLACTLLGSIACVSEPLVRLPQIGKYSPSVTYVLENPWRYADKVSKLVPNSDVFIGHGDSMLPLYPKDSVLVTQRIPWDKLQPGMSVLYSATPDDPFSMRVHLVTAIVYQKAITQGLNNPFADHTPAQESTYVGVVVAVYKQIENLPQELVRDRPIQPTCTFRCHAG